MIRIIYNEGIMDAKPLEVWDLLPAGDKLYSKLWRQINDRAMRMAARETETGILSVYVYRVRDEEDPWFMDEDMLYGAVPYGERICFGLVSRLIDEVTMSWWLPGQVRSWDYRTVNIKPEEDCYHD